MIPIEFDVHGLNFRKDDSYSSQDETLFSYSISQGAEFIGWLKFRVKASDSTIRVIANLIVEDCEVNLKRFEPYSAFIGSMFSRFCSWINYESFEIEVPWSGTIYIDFRDIKDVYLVPGSSNSAVPHSIRPSSDQKQKGG